MKSMLQDVTQQGIADLRAMRMRFALEMATILLKGADGRYPSLIKPSLIQVKNHIKRYYEIKNEC